MNFIQKIALSLFIVFFAVLTLTVCSPEPEPKKLVATEKIQIINIPARVFNTKVGSTEDQELYKVHIQLSKGMTAEAMNVAMGEFKVTEENKIGDTYTVLIDLYTPNPDTYWILDKTIPWSGTEWSNIAVLISPIYVDDIFDIDAKAAMSGSSAESTIVTLDWNRMLSRNHIINFSGMENYLRLYGMVGADDGVIVEDPEAVAGDPAIYGIRERANLDLITADHFKKE